MKSIFFLAALASGAFAQFDQNSKPFRLVLKSENATLDGQSLGACHQGAAIEGLCPSGNTATNETTSYDTFYHQTSPTLPTPDNDTYGVLVWNLTVNGDTVVPSTMRFSTDVMTDVAIPIFFPGNDTFTAVSFTSDGCMYITNYQDDTVSPPVRLDPPQKVENWYVCLTQWAYLYETLVWKVGRVGAPQNPSCQEVTVVREFV